MITKIDILNHIHLIHIQSHRMNHRTSQAVRVKMVAFAFNCQTVVLAAAVNMAALETDVKAVSCHVFQLLTN